MYYLFEFQPYSRNFKNPLKTSQGTWEKREGILIRLEDIQGNAFYSEIAPVPMFVYEPIESAKAFCASLNHGVNEEKINGIPEELCATRFAFESALYRPNAKRNKITTVSALLHGGAKAVELAKDLLKECYKTFKLKIGIEHFEEESKCFAMLVNALGHDCRYRLDANGGLTIEESKRWLEFLDDYPVEFLEQPLAPGYESEMTELLTQYKTPIALDESALTIKELQALEKSGWNGFLIIKPSLIGSLRQFLKWREHCSCPLIYSTALETAVGTNIGIDIALSDPNNNYALGYGVGQFFNNDGYNPKPLTPVLTSWHWKLRDMATIWNLNKQLC